MSFQSKADECQRNINTVRKELKSREDQARKGEPTFFIDTQIKGGFSELNTCLQQLEEILSNSSANYKDKEKLKKQYNDLVRGRDHLQTTYDSYFEKKTPVIGQYSSNEGDNQTNFQKKYDTVGLNTQQLNQLRTHQEHEQEELIDGLLDATERMKTAGYQTGNELDRHKIMLDTLQNKVDDNTQRITKTRGKMLRLLEESSNKLLFLIIFIEIAAVILIWTLWH